MVQVYCSVIILSSFPTQSRIRTRAARRCPSPAAPRTKPSSTAPSAPPTGSAPPPRPRPSPPHPTRAQRRPSLQGADRRKPCPSVKPGASLIPATNRGILFSLKCVVFNLLRLHCFCLVHFVLLSQCFLKMQMFSLELMKTK